MGLFLQHVVTDDNGDPLSGTAGQIYDLNDSNNASPLTVTTISGNPIPLNQVIANNDGITPDFICPGKKFVKWVSGSYEIGLVAADQIPSGGVPGQILSKSTAEDYDLIWEDPLGVAPGGVDGQVLVKDGSGDYQTRWADPFNSETGTNSLLGPGMVGFVRQNADGTWPTRPTSLNTVLVIWVGLQTWPPIVASGVNGPHVGDIFMEKRTTA